MAANWHEEAKCRFDFDSQLFLNEKKSPAGLFKKIKMKEANIAMHNKCYLN